MSPPSDAPPSWLPLVIIIGFPLFFVPLSCGVCRLLSTIGGWDRLAEKYPGSPTPTGTRFSMQGGRVGCVNYNGCLTIHTSPDGLHLAVWKIFRVGHPPLFISWADIHHAAARRVFWSESVVFEVGAPSIAKLQLSKKIFEGGPVVF
jgi:hypothetical protein